MAVWEAMKIATERARSGGGPTLIECKTYRVVGHHEGDPVVGTYRTQEEIDAWVKRDPIEMFRTRLVQEYGLAGEDELAAMERKIDGIVAEALDFARKSPQPDPATLSLHVFADPINPPEATQVRPSAARPAQQGWLEAVRDGIAEEMRANHGILYFGEGTGERGGSFAHTKGLWAEFGEHRMVDTPISEQGFTAAAIGASAIGARTVSDVMFADFAFEAAGQIMLQGAKLRYMSNGGMSAPFVLRAAMGALRSSGPHHSGSYHPIFAQMPGLIVCLPSNPADAKGLMKTALARIRPGGLSRTKGAVCVQGRGARRAITMSRSASPGSPGRVAISRSSRPVSWWGRQRRRPKFWRPKGSRPRSSTRVPSCRSTSTPSSRAFGAHIVCWWWTRPGPCAGWAARSRSRSMNWPSTNSMRRRAGCIPNRFRTRLRPFWSRRWSSIPTVSRRRCASVIAGRPPVPRHWMSQSSGRPAVSAPAPTTSPAKPAMAPSHTPLAAIGAVVENADEPILMPFGDLTVSEGTLIRWAKAKGDRVSKGELVAEIETDKAVVEIEAPVSGVLHSVEAEVGQVIAMGARIGGIAG